MFGSGETTASGRKIFDQVFQRLPDEPAIAMLETPAGFELNSDQVVGRIADFLIERLQNYNPQPVIVPARKRGTAFSPDDPDIIAPIYSADSIFMGPGSPTYAVRQLKDSLAWQALIARHRLGAALVLASAATVAISRFALPVYEIYKVGEDIHWKEGLDLFGQYGLPLVFVPHWNNQEGGEGLDTSRCYIGKARFEPLMERLPDEIGVVGIDERTALEIDLMARTCRVLGLDGVTILRAGEESRFEKDEDFPLSMLGEVRLPDGPAGVEDAVWRQALATQAARDEKGIPHEIQALVQEREAAREARDWGKADRIREELEEQGWQVEDTRQGPRIKSSGGPRNLPA